jgi:hypothetical protein
MRVFISWSGEPSRLIAKALTEWLRPVVQHIEPWMSDEQIRSGTRWREVIGKALDATDFGIICLTQANQHEAWLVFEAGALAKRLEVARLVPLFIDLAPSDVTGPLEGWQGQRLDREGVRRLVYDLNEAADKSVPEGGLGALFDAMWPQLETAIDEAVEGAPLSQEPLRRPDQMLAEVVDTVRRIERATAVAPVISDLSLDPIKIWTEAPFSPGDEAVAEALTSHALSVQRLAATKLNRLRKESEDASTVT